MRRTTILSTQGPIPARPARTRPTEDRASTGPSARRAVIAVSPRPDTIVITVGDEDDVDEGLERLRVELEALVYSSELV